MKHESEFTQEIVEILLKQNSACVPFGAKLKLSECSKSLAKIFSNSEFMQQVELKFSFPMVIAQDHDDGMSYERAEALHERRLRNDMRTISSSKRRYRNLCLSHVIEDLDLRSDNWLELTEKLQWTVHLKIDSCVLLTRNYASILGQFNRLETMKIHNCMVKKQKNGRKKLRMPRMSRLRELRITSSDDVLIQEVFTKVESLQVLELEITGSCQYLEKFISRQKNLESLKIVNNDTARNRSLYFGKTTSQLESLSLKFILLSKNSKTFFANQNKLKHVELSIDHRTDESTFKDTMHHILSNKELSTLKLEKDTFDVDGEVFFENVKASLSVTSLTYREKKFNYSQPDFFPSLINLLPNIQRIQIDCTGNDEEDLKYVSALSNLQNLESLELINVNDYALTYLNARTLKSVKFEIHSDEGSDTYTLLLFLQRNPQLTKLTLGYPSLEVDASICQNITKMLPDLEYLSVAVFDCSINDCVLHLLLLKKLQVICLSKSDYKNTSRETKEMLKSANIAVTFHEIEIA